MSVNKKILAITPLACVIIYLLLGFLLGGMAWAWGLFIFLLVPLMPYILRTKKLRISTTFVIVLIYLIVCFVGETLDKHIWHPMWIIFLLIPIIEILRVPTKKENKKSDNSSDTVYVESKIED